MTKRDWTWRPCIVCGERVMSRAKNALCEKHKREKWERLYAKHGKDYYARKEVEG